MKYYLDMTYFNYYIAIFKGTKLYYIIKVTYGHNILYFQNAVKTGLNLNLVYVKIKLETCLKGSNCVNTCVSVSLVFYNLPTHV